MPLPYLRLLGAQLAIGAAAIFARFALTGAGPIAVSALRLGIAACIALAIAGRLQRIARQREFAFAIAGVTLALHFAGWIASLRYTSVAISTLLVTTTPMWTELYDVLRERRTPSRAYAVALALGFAGVWLIAAQPSAMRAPLPGHELLGDALALGGSVAIGAYLLLVKAAGAQTGAAAAGCRLGTRQIVARTYGWGALALTIGMLLAHEGPPPLADARAWAGVLAMAFVSQLIGHTALNAALRDFAPSTIAFSTLLEPAIAAIFAAEIFHETLSATAAFGGVLVLAAIATTLRATPAASAAECAAASEHVAISNHDRSRSDFERSSKP